VKPPRSPKYLAWVRQKPCAVAGCRFGAEAAHTGSHGISQKASDYSAIPLCSNHHRTGTDALHRMGPRAFAHYHKLDIPAVIRALHKAAGPLVPEKYRTEAA